ncbi:MAG: hypothetical protein EPN93_02570 [Spirochaetes bacterium]|nr:MAG: hypothetical protein EPN93_02570 [Spirochaetota bacterium]
MPSAPQSSMCRRTLRFALRAIPVFACLIAGFLITCSRGREPDPGAQKSWAYIMSGMLDTSADAAYLESAASRYDVICLTGYYLNARGDLVTSEANVALLKRISGAKSICPLVTFSSAADGTAMLKSETARENAVARLAALLEKHRLQGIHFDFEYIPPEHAKRLAEFLALARAKLSSEGAVRLSMAIFPPVDFPEKWAKFHDLSLIGKHLDEIVLMCYDLNRADTSPGPVTSLQWAERNIDRVARVFPSARTWLGIPAYGYAWPPRGRAQVIAARDAAAESSRYSGKRDSSGTITYSYQGPAGTHRVYFSDAETRRLLAVLAQKKGLAGTALWRLGLED